MNYNPIDVGYETFIEKKQFFAQRMNSGNAFKDYRAFGKPIVSYGSSQIGAL